ncbi:MAG: catalase [Planctomycetes bacterium]|nr:catalase [Planctomycetota bacterium]
MTVSYGPGGKSGPHRHAGSVFAYVLSGAIRSENSATGPARVYRAGESFFEPAASEHLVSENASDTDPASLLAVFIAPEGSVLTTSHDDNNAVEKEAGTAASLVDALNQLFGPQTTGRAVHTKGVVLEGRFTPDPAARALSRAPHFQAPVAVTVRFSNFAGVKSVADTDALANPRGVAVKFQLPDGTQTDLVMHSFNGFPAATAEEFRRFLIALATSGPGAAKPTPAETYLAAHPVAKAFLDSQTPAPLSYATLPYFGVNSYKFTNSAGQERIGRYRIEPDAGEQFMPAEQLAGAPADYLAREIRERVANAPVRLRLRVQLAQRGDAIQDPSVAWPEGREFVELGMIELRTAVPKSDEAEQRLLFRPGSLPTGIEAADPMIELRDGAYLESFARRHRASTAPGQNQNP